MRIALIVILLMLGSTVAADDDELVDGVLSGAGTTESAALAPDAPRDGRPQPRDIYSPDPNNPAVMERLQFWSTWNRQNSLARRVQIGREDLETILLVDPTLSRIAKIDGKGKFVGSLLLPEHKNWRAFFVTPQGIAELTFPVRIQWVDSDHAMPEQILIRSLERVTLGPGNVGTFVMTFGHGHAGIGYQTMGTTETYRLRLKESDAKPDQQSMLLGVDRGSLEYRKSIEVGQTNMSVIEGE